MTGSDPVRGDARVRGSLSGDLMALEQRSQGSSLTFGDLIRALRGRGLAMLIFILALPFCLPLPLIGVTIPFGLVIAFFGVRLGFGLKPWLPKALLERRISAKAMRRFLRAGMGLARWLEKVVHSRWDVFTQGPGMRWAIGLSIAICGLGLMLPVPFTNIIVGAAIVLLSLGIMEGDGLFVILGFLTGALFYGLLAAMIFLGKLGWENLLSLGSV